MEHDIRTTERTRTVEGVVERYLETWRAGDMEAWGELFTEDCDFVTWAGLWWRSRRENVDGHRNVPPIVAAQRQNYAIELARVARLTPELALVHARWSWPAFRATPEATPEDREGIVTMLMIETGSGWRIRASHNARIPDNAR